ncbi:MAG: ankyrin repeat domain-containing protein [Alphaproteobacteria bacterium]
MKVKLEENEIEKLKSAGNLEELFNIKESIYNKYIDTYKLTVERDQLDAELAQEIFKIFPIEDLGKNDQHIKDFLLICAIETRDLIRLQGLLDKKANVNVANNYKQSALLYAASWGYKEIIEELLNNGANVDAQNNYGDTALHIAVSNDKNEMAELLIDNKTNLNLKNSEGRTALHLAVINSEFYLVKRLIDAGANIDIQDEQDDTALHYAANKGREEIVNLLLNNGANISIQNVNGHTAYQIAGLSFHAEIANLLEAKSREVTQPQNVNSNQKLHIKEDNESTQELRAEVDDNKFIQKTTVGKQTKTNTEEKTHRKKLDADSWYNIFDIAATTIALIFRNSVKDFRLFKNIWDKIVPIGKAVIEVCESRVGTIPLSTATKDTVKHYSRAVVPVIAIAAIVKAVWVFYNEFTKDGFKKSAKHAVGEAGKTVTEGVVGVAGATVFTAFATTLGVGITIAPVVGGCAAAILAERAINYGIKIYSSRGR